MIGNNASGCNSLQEVEDACLLISAGSRDDPPVMSVFPNPVSGSVTIKVTGFSEKSCLTIMNPQGFQLIKLLVYQPETVIDLSGLPRGMYYIRLEGDRIVRAGKIIKL